MKTPSRKHLLRAMKTPSRKQLLELKVLVGQLLWRFGGPSHPAQARLLGELDRGRPARSTASLIWLLLGESFAQAVPPETVERAERELRAAYDATHRAQQQGDTPGAVLGVAPAGNPKAPN